MAAEEEAPRPAAPAPFVACSLEAALELWNDVERGLWKDQPVVDYAEALRSLESAHYNARSSVSARAFVDKNMAKMVHVLLGQEPAKLDDREKDCVKKALLLSLQIVVEDLDRVDDNGICNTLDALKHIFRRSQAYYSRRSGGLSQRRRRMITGFQQMHGFKHLISYINARVTSPQFPDLQLVVYSLEAMHDIMPGRYETDLPDSFDPSRAEAWEMAQVVMKHLSDETSLVGLTSADAKVRVEKVFAALINLSESSPADLEASFSLWMSLTLRMMRSKSHQMMRLSGWNQIAHLVEASERMRPPPRAYLVEGAGTEFINGRYDMSSDMTTERGYAKPLNGIVGLRKGVHGWQYHRRVPHDGAPDSAGAGKTITLFQCLMRSQAKWWFLSEPDKDQPGTDADVDYYQYKSNKNEEGLPSLSGWLTCHRRGRGQDPAPTLKPVGLMVPRGEEESTPEHLLAKWAIENNLVELALGDSANEEIVAKATALVQFLVRMCSDSFAAPQKYCLQASHLAFASQSIERTTDAMTLAQMHLLLLTIRESLPEGLQEMIRPISKSATLRRIQLNDPTLLTLQLGSHFALGQFNEGVGAYLPVDGPDFARIGHSVSTNNHLEAVHFDSTIRFEGMNSALTAALFQGLKQNSSIRSLRLSGCDLSQSAGAGVLATFRERNTKLLDISVLGCNLEDEGSRVLSSTLRACTNIRDLPLSGNGIEDNDLVDIIAAIRDHSQLEMICLSGNNIEKVDPLADLLSNPQCNLVTIELGNNRINSAGAIMLARALAKNKKLVKLDLAGNNRIVWDVEVFDAFSKSICDTASVNATYLSNHTLESIIGIPDDDWEVEELDLLLQLNTLTDKDRVAMRKILRCHSQIDMIPFFEWDLKALPLAVSWFDKAKFLSDEVDGDEKAVVVDARKLSAIYQFTQAMPLIVVLSLRDGQLPDISGAEQAPGSCELL